MNPTHDPYELAGEYVLGTLSRERRREVDAMLPNDATLRAAVAYWEERLMPLNALVAPVAPAGVLWPRIERSLAPVTAPAAVRPGWWERLGLWRALAAGGFAAAAIMAAVVGVRQFEVEQSRYMVVLAAPQNAGPGWVLELVADDTLRLDPLVTTEVPADRALQLWTKADDWEGPVSLGLVKPGESVEVKLANLPKVVPNQLFEITLEPAAGSPIGRPTGPILYIGRAVRI
ncbi:RNA polymerase subunit sigma-70 [Massilia aurea]|uniref:RNA polymerase subunit sigma-70 n=1 Tax=Massilia aurea TaxID=373040 RepID=A0A422QFY9_9BURK|nr:anti-sigma factor [Massilia aurea]RNF28871.1 RNA polymerase subunit sigma-70 [Massilia aurea]